MPEPAAPDETPDLTGRAVGEYQVLRKIGQGGMGQVYLARQLSLKRDVALKILRKDLAENPTALKRFQAEAEAVARVTHANIVQVYAVGEQDGLRFMALEFVDGRNLRDYLARKGPPELPVAVSILKQVAAALQRSAEIGIVHRDIKPENILVTRKVEVKVADFGLSRYFANEGQPLNLTQSGMTLGTPLYMSPEQVQGQTVDHRSDLYSFGITAYHLLAGHPPFSGTTAFEVALQHVQVDPPSLAMIRPDLPSDLCAIVHKLIAKKPADRYPSARDVIRDLSKVQKGLTVGLPATASTPDQPALGAGTQVMPGMTLSGVSGSVITLPGYAPPPARWPKIVLGVLILVGIAGGGWWSFGRFHRPTEAKPIVAGPGLPDARPPEPVVSVRERELKAKIESRAAKPAEVFDAALELGVLYVRERRLDDAEKLFKDLETDRPDRFGPALKAGLSGVVLAGRLGQAVVLAHRDKAKESNDAFEKVLLGPPRLPSLVVEKFILAHPDFGQAVAEALTRNAENLNVTRLSERLEYLRTPAGLAKGPKGG